MKLLVSLKQPVNNHHRILTLAFDDGITYTCANSNIQEGIYCKIDMDEDTCASGDKVAFGKLNQGTSACYTDRVESCEALK